MFDAIVVLDEQFSFSSWKELIKYSLIFIQIFNRRGAGEIERLTIENYINKEIITETIGTDILEEMSEDSVEFAKQFVRVTMRGKLGRTVSVLLNPLCTKAIDLILKYRSQAGIPISNKFIFSKNITSKLAKPYYRACPLLKQFSVECGADMPDRLRGTSLRKHIATYTSLLNVEDSTVDTLANFMGHHKDIHKSIYRVSVPVAEVTCLSKLLMSAVGDEEEEDNEEHNEVQTFQDISSNISITSSSNKTRSTVRKTTRRKWTQEEEDAIYSIFGNVKALEKLPTSMQCVDAITTQLALQSRTPEQLKSWIDNQMRYEKRAMTKAAYKEDVREN